MDLPKETLEEMLELVKSIKTSEKPKELRDEYVRKKKELEEQGYNLTPLYDALNHLSS